jgi:hypothetical protein
MACTYHSHYFNARLSTHLDCGSVRVLTAAQYVDQRRGRKAVHDKPNE